MLRLAGLGVPDKMPLLRYQIGEEGASCPAGDEQDKLLQRRLIVFHSHMGKNLNSSCVKPEEIPLHSLIDCSHYVLYCPGVKHGHTSVVTCFTQTTGKKL